MNAVLLTLALLAHPTVSVNHTRWSVCAIVRSREALYVVIDDARTPESDIPTTIRSTVAIIDSTSVKPASARSRSSAKRSWLAMRQDPMHLTSAARAGSDIT